jgi:dUTP pyrophosphatase
MWSKSKMKKLEVMKTKPGAIVPTRAYANDAGLDLVTLEGANLKPGEGRIFPTGLAVAIDAGYVGLICDRSSMGKRGLRTLGGVVDSGYRGEVGVILWNVSDAHQVIEEGQKIAQLLILPVATPPVFEVTVLSDAERGEKGFGSSGA